MSRTIRRKNVSWGRTYNRFRNLEKTLEHEDSLGFDITGEREHLLAWARCSPKQDIGQVKLKKLFHSDKLMTFNKPSWWVRVQCHRPLRTKNRVEMHKALLLNDLEDVEYTYQRLAYYFW